MIICSNCKHKEMVGALFCSECGAQLDASKGLVTGAFDSPFKDQGQELPDIPPQESIPVLSARLTLYFYQYEAFTRLGETGEYSFGRVNEGQSTLPDIDLSGYDGFKNGVSRVHASIRISDRRVEIKDLGSANGTRLNSRKLTPLVPYPLQDGDVLVFGKLQARVIMKSNDG